MEDLYKVTEFLFGDAFVFRSAVKSPRAGAVWSSCFECPKGKWVINRAGVYCELDPDKIHDGASVPSWCRLIIGGGR